MVAMIENVKNALYFFKKKMVALAEIQKKVVALAEMIIHYKGDRSG